MRFMAIDLGDRRTGIALGDETTGLVSPLAVIDVARGERLVEALLAKIDEVAPDAIVMGLPINMDDTEGPRAKIARDFGARLAAESGLAVHFQDERLTSFAAEEHLAGSGRTRGEKRAIRDALAAAEILRDFLGSRPDTGRGR